MIFHYMIFHHLLMDHPRYRWCVSPLERVDQGRGEEEAPGILTGGVLPHH